MDFKDFLQLDEAGYGRNKGYAHGFASPHAPSLGSRHREDDEYHVPDKKPADHPHAVHINGKKWKSFDSQSHATNVANKIKGATVHKEEVEIAEATTGATKLVHTRTGKDGAKYHIMQDSPTDYSIHREHNGKTKHIDTYGSLHRAKSVLDNEVKEEVVTEGYGEDDVANGGTVIYKHEGKHYMSKVSHKTGGGAGTKIHTTSSLKHVVPLHHVVSTDASDWPKYKSMKEETMPQSFKGFLTSLTELTDKQKKIDKNHNGKLDGQDFKMLRKEDEHNEQAPVAPVPDKKYIKGTPENKALKAARKPINGHPTNKMKEEVELDEAFINGREYASHGLMHPDHAKMDIHQKANREVDFYASKTGNKMHGRVMKNDGKEVHIQAHKELGDGKLHKFKVKPNLPKTTNEDHKKDDVPFDGPYKKTSGDGSVKDKSGAVHTPMSRARDLARKAMQKKMKEEFNIEITEEQAADLCDTASLHEKMDMTKADMGDVIKDFKKSDAPQFAGKSDEKRREMAIAAKLQADRGGKKSYREFVELIAPQIQEGSPDEKVRDVAENAFDLKKSKTPASSGRYDIKQDGNRTIVTRKYNPDTGHSTGTDDEEKPEGEKRGRGRPAGSTSGAKQKGSANKSDYRGIDYKTHSLHLPNSK